jgi:RNA-binding protein
MISKKHKMYLRSLANRLDATVSLGKDGLTENVIKALDVNLTANELVKISLLKSCPLQITEAAVELAAETHSQIIQTIGHRAVFYRANPDKKVIKWPQ